MMQLGALGGEEEGAETKRFDWLGYSLVSNQMIGALKALRPHEYQSTFSERFTISTPLTHPEA